MNYIIFFLLSCLLVSCNGNTSDTGEFTNSYHYNDDGCSTGEHKFKASTKKEVTKQMCNAFQNDKLNNSCAEMQRELQFNQQCEGLIWSPIYSNQEKSKEDVDVKIYDSIEEKEKVRKSLQYLVSDKITYNENLDEKESVYAARLAQDFRDCTFSYVGPKCDINVVIEKGAYGKLIRVDYNYYFITDLFKAGTEDRIALAFLLEVKNGEVSSKKVTVYKRDDITDIDDFYRSFVFKNSSLLELFSIKISNELDTVLLNRIENPTSLRALSRSIFVLEYISRSFTHDHRKEIETNILKSLKQHSKLIEGLKDSEYKDPMIKLMNEFTYYLL